ISACYFSGLMSRGKYTLTRAETTIGGGVWRMNTETGEVSYCYQMYMVALDPPLCGPWSTRWDRDGFVSRRDAAFCQALAVTLPAVRSLRDKTLSKCQKPQSGDPVRLSEFSRDPAGRLIHRGDG